MSSVEGEVVNRAFPGSEEHQLSRAPYNTGPGKRLSLTSPGLTRSWPLPTLRKRLPGDECLASLLGALWTGSRNTKDVSSPPPITPVPEAATLSTHGGGWAFPPEATP